MAIAAGDGTALLRELVRIDSRNPSLVPGGPGEGAVAAALADVLRAWGFRVEVRDAAPGRPNVLARIGPGGGRALMFNGHLDVVGTEGMVHEPWAAAERAGRLYGRGASDMKGGVAAMCAAAFRAGRTLASGEVIVAAVADEEFQSIGTRALVDWGVRAEAAIVTEPTQLSIMPAHKGFAWIRLEFRGRAAHGSRWELGVDAIRHAGLFLSELQALDGVELPQRSHPLLGRPSVHASTITGGEGMSTYPDRCVLTVERRTIPGETAAQVRAEVDALCAAVRAREPRLSVEVTVDLVQSPSDVPVDAPVVRALSAAMRQEGLPVRIEGMSAWTDAAILNDAGIPAICFGPGDIALAHAAEEYIEIEQVEPATRVLERLALGWGQGDGDAWRS
jgi:acetylornithine deacetylase